MLELQTFGGLELSTEAGEPVDALAGRTKCLALLARLATEAPGGRVRRDELAALLWPGGTDQRARNSLRVALTHIRGAAPPELLREEGTSRLALARREVRADVTLFLEALESGDEARALDLYRGDFLQGVRVEDAREFQRWADRSRGRYRRAAYEAALSLGASAREAGDLAAAENRFRTALDLAPLREEAAEPLIRTLADRGRTADAVQLYEAFRARRREELDMTASAALEELVEELRSSPPAPPTDEPNRGERETGAAPRSADSSETGPRKQIPFAPRIQLGGLVLIGLLAAALSGAWYLMASANGAADISEGTMAVLPFATQGSTAEDLEGGFVTMLNARLGGVSGLRVIPGRTVFAEWEEGGWSREQATSEETLGVARKIGAEYAIVGSAAEINEELQLLALVHDTRSGDRLGQVAVRGRSDRVSALADSLARRVLGVVLEKRDEALASADPGSILSRSLPALKSFIAGERHLRDGEFGAATEFFRAAIRRDSTFALAYAHLARTVSWDRGSLSAGRPAWKRALALSDQLTERERRLVRVMHLRRIRNRESAAIDTLQLLTEAYPDDPLVWYNLGEALWHQIAPGGWPEADRAFRRAVELDPGHALYYPHYAQLGIVVHHDSARAARRIDAIPNGDWREAYRVVLDLAFGDAGARRQALARLDSIPMPRVWHLGLWHALHHPADGEPLEELLRSLIERPGRKHERYFRQRLVLRALRRGEIAEALDLQREIQLPHFARHLAMSVSLGGVRPETVARYLADPLELDEDASPPQLLTVAMYLVERGHGDQIDSLIRRYRWSLRSVGDGALSSREVERRVRGLRGYRAWKSGELDRAARLWSVPNVFGSRGAIWRGDLYRSRGQLEKAERWYLGGWLHPVAHQRLGRLYEEMGRPEEAAAAYRRFIAGWEDADERLQPRVDRVRGRLSALGSEDGTD